MRIAIIGAGYVGLVTGTCFADWGWHVTCVDKNENKISQLKNGDIPIYEPGLEELVEHNIQRKTLNFTTSTEEAISNADAVFIAVGTPMEKSTGRADLKYVFAAVEEVARAAKSNLILVTKSTVPVGTAEKLKELIAGLKLKVEIEVASNPEFLREGSAVRDFMEPDRVVIGAETTRAKTTLQRLYASLAQKSVPVLVTDCATAELIKYAANTYLATRIAFINEVADIAEKLGADIGLVSKGMGLDHRIGETFLATGPGYGGSCFPKDTEALIAISEDAGCRSRIVEAVVEANYERKKNLANRVKKALGGKLSGKKIAVLGLTFKAHTDDMRDSPSLDLIPALLAEGAAVTAHDPAGMEAARTLLPAGVNYAADIISAVSGADAVVILTEWPEFRTVEIAELRNALKQPLMIDFRNMFDPSFMAEHGFTYHSVGRMTVMPERKIALVK